MPPPIPLELERQYKKSEFGLEDKFTFLFAFDYHSYFERKNPIAVIKAFNKAFGNNDKIQLIIKTSNSDYDKKAARKLKQLEKSNIKIINKDMPHNRFIGFLSCCDCFVSLHRAEGFGLIIAEAMALSKPVITTAYSGNMDFTNNKNSYLVNHKLKKIKKSVGPYKKGNLWAEPNINHAAELMREVFYKREASKKIGKIAAAYIKKEFSPEVVGNKIKDRLKLAHKNLSKT